MKIAKRNPFSGLPVIHTPAVFGASTGKQFLYRIPVTGQRPIVISAENLPKGVSLCDGILSGTVDNDCEFCIKLCAENSEGKTTKIFNMARNTTCNGGHYITSISKTDNQCVPDNGTAPCNDRRRTKRCINLTFIPAVSVRL